MLNDNNADNHVCNILSGDHFIFLYKDPENKQHILKNLINGSIKRFKKVIYLYEEPLSAENKLLFSNYQESPHVNTYSIDKFFFAEGKFSLDNFFKKITLKYEKSIESGFNSLVFSFEMDWSYKFFNKISLLVHFENLLSDFTKGKKISFLCLININHQDSYFLNKMLMFHSHVIIGYNIYNNIYDIDPQNLKKKGMDQYILDESIKNIKNYHNALIRLEKQKHDMNHIAKMAALGTLVAGVAHEINNPANLIALNAPLLEEMFNDIKPILDSKYKDEGDFLFGDIPYTEAREYVNELFEGIISATERIRKIVMDLKEFSKKDLSDLKTPANVNVIIKSAVSLLNPIIKKHTNKFIVNLKDNLPKILANSIKIEQVIINLITNSLESLANKNKCVTISSSYDPNIDSIFIMVEDEGVGMNNEEISQALDPFFTTKREYGGTGMGLSICEKIINEHKGRLDILSTKNKGSIVKISLPTIKKA